VEYVRSRFYVKHLLSAEEFSRDFQNNRGRWIIFKSRMY